MTMTFDVTVSGPLFGGQFPRIIKDISEDARREVGNAALERVQFILDKNIKHPTPYYETQIIQQAQGRYEVVHDRGIIYGPWLEGTSSRNSSTRFKGYASFRKATQDVEALVPGILERVIAKNIGRLQ